MRPPCKPLRYLVFAEDFRMNEEWAEIRHIRYLLEIMKQGGVRAAAECLHASPPNLCTQANQFQEHYNIRLYREASGQSHSAYGNGRSFPRACPKSA